MKSRAAVAFGPGQPLKIVEIDVMPPTSRRSADQSEPFRGLPYRCLYIIR